MGASRVLPSNPTTNTYDSAGGKDYSDLGVWEAATDVNCVGTTTSYVLDCYKGAHSDNVELADATTDGTYHRVIKAASGEGYIDILNGIPAIDGSCVYLVSTGGTNHTVLITETYSQLWDVVIANLKNWNSGNTAAVKLEGSQSKAIGVCAYRSINPDATYRSSGFRSAGAGTYKYIINCIAIECDQYGFFVNSGHAYIYNCTSYNNTQKGLYMDGQTCAAKNCIFTNGITVNSGTLNQTTNTVSTPTFRTAAGYDFRLTRADTVAKYQGTDLSADGVFAFDDDVMYNRRHTGRWDIGAFKYNTRKITI